MSVQCAVTLKRPAAAVPNAKLKNNVIHSAE